MTTTPRTMATGTRSEVATAGKDVLWRASGAGSALSVVVNRFVDFRYALVMRCCNWAWRLFDYDAD